MSTTTTKEELIQLRKDLADIHHASPSPAPNGWRPPIIDASTPDADETGLATLSTCEITGIKAFQSLVLKEISALDKYLNDPDPTRPISTNALYLTSVWKEVAQASSLVAIGKIFKSEAASIGGAVSKGPSRNTTKDSKPTIKVDVVADEGRSWIRINSVKNSRIQAELNEIDAYAHEDPESDSDGEPNSLSKTTPLLGNSVIRMGKALVEAAKCNPLPGTSVIPQVTMRLVRLAPDPPSDPSSTLAGKSLPDPRIQRSIEELQKMGITVLLGEREGATPSKTLEPLSKTDATQSSSTTQEEYPTPPLRVTQQLNLDLSLLVAIVSDLVHSPVPADEEESITRYTLPARSSTKKELTQDGGAGNSHSSPLSDQVNQERNIGLLKAIHNRLSTPPSQQPGSIKETSYQFWTTSEAKTRLLSRVSKIGGPNEKRRANALFLTSREEAEDQFWKDSRFPLAYIKGLVPVMVYPTPEPDPKDDKSVSLFHCHLAQACRSVLADLVWQSTSQPPIPPSLATPSYVPTKATPRVRGNEKHDGSSRSQNNIPMHPASLTFHTVRSLLWGASNGMTTITANKTSIKAISREMKKPAGHPYGSNVDTSVLLDDTRAAIWVVKSRNLSEIMRTDRIITET